MSNSILEKKWTRWYPEKIFLEEEKKNLKILYFLDKLKEEDFFTDFKNQKKDTDNQKKDNIKLETDLTKTELYKTGFKKGFLAGKEENICLEKKLNNWLLDFENSFSMFEQALYTRLLQIVLKVSSYVIGKKIHIDESYLLKYIKKIIDKDGIFLKKPQLIVHPDNKILIEKILKKFLNSYKWTLVYDDSVDLNSCKVKSENGDMDATMNARWQELCRLIDLKEEYE